MTLNDYLDRLPTDDGLRLIGIPHVGPNNFDGHPIATGIALTLKAASANGVLNGPQLQWLVSIIDTAQTDGRIVAAVCNHLARHGYAVWEFDERNYHFYVSIPRLADGLKQLATPPAPPPVIGHLRLPEIRKAFPDLNYNQIERLRKRLERWRKTNEDKCHAPPDGSGGMGWAYPVSVVETKVSEVIRANR